MKIEKKLINTTKKYSGTNGKRFVVIHQTGNTNIGADADAHHNLQANGNVRNASWHISVDDKKAIQSFSYDMRCWHAGDGDARNGGNFNGIAIEICINEDGNYIQAVKNGASVAKQVLKELGLGIDALKQHNFFSGKNCPAQIRANKSGINWDDFIALVKEDTKPISKPAPKPQGKSVTVMAQEVIKGLHGNGHEARRKSLGISTSEYNKVRTEVNRLSGVKVVPRKSISQMASEIIDGKHGNGHEKRRKSLGISASEYAKVRAEVNKRL